MPSAYDVDTGDTLLPTQTETPFEDLETDMNTPRPVVAGGTGGATAKAGRAGLLVRELKALDTAGSADTYTVTSGDSLTPSDGDAMIVIINATCTGASTLNVDATGAKAIKKMVAGTATALAANDLYAGHHYQLSYDTGAVAWLLFNYVDVSDFITSVVADTTPQLGGQLDVNGNAIGDGTLELLTFTEDASAVNHVNIENEATGSGPIISSAGDNTNVDLNIDTKATGALNLKTGGTVRVDLTASGMRLGAANARVTTVLDEDAMGTDSATALATQQSIKAYVETYADRSTLRGVNAQTDTTYTTVLSDAGKLVTSSNGSAQTHSIPLNSSVAYAVGDWIAFAYIGAEVLTITGATGVTVNGASAGGAACPTKFSTYVATKIATDTWLLNIDGVS